MGHCLSPAHTRYQRVGQIYILGVQHSFIVHRMTFHIFADQRVHKSRPGPCHAAQPRPFLLINSNLAALCLMQCGSSWPGHCREASPLWSPLKVQGPFFRGPVSRLKATLTPAGCQWYFRLKLPLSIPINPCSDPYTGGTIKRNVSWRLQPHSYGDLTISLWLWTNGSPLLRWDGGGLSL